MAEEKKAKGKEPDKEKAEADATEAAPAAPGRKKLLLLGGIGAAVLLLGGAGAGFVLLRSPAPETAAAGEHGAAEPAAAHAPEPAHAEPAPEDHSLGEGRGEHPASAGGGSSDTLPLEVFVVNIKDKDRDRYLKVKAEVQVSAPAVSEEIQKRLPQVRDVFISLLASKSFEEVRSIEGKNFLREELLLRVNSLLRAGTVTAIYFTEFVVQ